MTEEIIKHLMKEHGSILSSLTIGRLVIGKNFTAVQLSDGSCGLAGSEYTDRSQNIHPHERFFGNFASGNFRGAGVTELLNFNEDTRIAETVKIAVINAVSSAIGNEVYPVVRNTDTLDVLDLSGKKKITIVGAFHNYIKRLLQTNHELKVVELTLEALRSEHAHLFVPFSDSAEVLAQSDIVIMTGSSFVNRTFERLVGMCGANTFKVLIGPTGGMLPEFLFAKGIDVIGTTKIKDADLMFRIIEEGGSGFHLFEKSAEKICIRRSN